MVIIIKNVVLHSNQVYLSETANPDSYIAKFVICDFGRNKNGVALDRDTIEDWMSTLKNKPLVGKIRMRYDGEYDFTGHNVIEVEKEDEYGNTYREVEFDTEAFGTFFDVSIEKIDGKEFIVASCEIWKRFSQACEIITNRIKDGTLSTSWEIAVECSSQKIIDGFMTQIIKAGRFIGHCLLGRDVDPAYDSSGLLEIASTNYDVEFAEALTQDILSQGLDIKNEAKEENNMAKTKETEISEEVVKDTVESTPEAEATVEDAASKETTEETVNSQSVEGELREQLAEANSKIEALNADIATRDEAIIKSGEEIASLKAQITELTPFKEQFEEAEKARIEAELSEKKEALIASVTKTGLITREEIEASEEFKGFVDNLDDKSLKAVLADRYIASFNAEKPEVAETVTKTDVASTNLDGLEDKVVDVKNIMKNYFGK